MTGHKIQWHLRQHNSWPERATLCLLIDDQLLYEYGINIKMWFFEWRVNRLKQKMLKWAQVNECYENNTVVWGNSKKDRILI